MNFVVPETTVPSSDGDGLRLEAESVSDVPMLTVEYVTIDIL